MLPAHSHASNSALKGAIIFLIQCPRELCFRRVFKIRSEWLGHPLLRIVDGEEFVHLLVVVEVGQQNKIKWSRFAGGFEVTYISPDPMLPIDDGGGSLNNQL